MRRVEKGYVVEGSEMEFTGSCGIPKGSQVVCTGFEGFAQILKVMHPFSRIYTGFRKVSTHFQELCTNFGGVAPVVTNLHRF